MARLKASSSRRRTQRHHQRERIRTPNSSRRSSGESSESEEAEQDDPPRGTGRSRHVRSPTTPRTKRQSIANLRDLVQRQREAQHARKAAPAPQEDGASDVLLAALLQRRLGGSGDRRSAETDERRLIQVAVRCRPRRELQQQQQRQRERERERRRRQSKSQRLLLSDTSDSQADDDDDDEDDDDGGDDDISDASEDARAPPRDSVVSYSLPETAGARPSVSVPPHVLAVGSAPRRRFEFDFVFPPWRSQRDVYAACVEQQVAHVLQTATSAESAVAAAADAHMTVIAYGQTGTGKTYTMGMLPPAGGDALDAEECEDDGDGDGDGDGSAQGLIPRALAQILASVEAFNRANERVQLEARLSFLQIYLETIEDLLAPRPTPLQVRLDVAANVFYVDGLQELELRSVGDARRALAAASRRRVLAATARNKTSSRSHTLLTISLRRRRCRRRHHSGEDDDDDNEEQTSDDGSSDGRAASSVSFVDLAGSERVDGALHFLHAARRRQELRIREAKFINRSLSALGSVISSLAAQSTPPSSLRHSRSPRASPRSRRRLQAQQRVSPTRKAPAHIRFRDSQLTKLLQSRLLHGRGRLLLIATIDDRPQHLTETLSTLKFAAQCRRVELGAGALRAAENRKRREESLLKQVFADVRVMYEEREAALCQRYDARIATLEAQLRQSQSQPQSDSQPMREAPYVALCSLVDQLRRSNATRHPALHEFQDGAAVAQYVAALYQELKAAIVAQSQSPYPKIRRRRTVSGEPSPSRRASERAASPPSAQPPPEAVAVVAPLPSPFLSPSRETANEATTSVDEFEAIARCLFLSRALDDISVSSDDGDDAFSQLEARTSAR
ncbi:hypothetical protein PINS_up002322 [Pythium insidiosum]|nr:hypothetical protein PINS_up002322 [Pythium insidiosum]